MFFLRLTFFSVISIYSIGGCNMDTAPKPTNFSPSKLAVPVLTQPIISENQTISAPVRQMKPETPASTGEILIRDVPHIHQKPDFCGEACVAMYMQKLGKKVDQDWVFDFSKTNPSMGRGIISKELTPTLEKMGFKKRHPYFGAWNTKQIEHQFEKLVADLKRGVPSIVCMHYSDAPMSTEHFRLVLGFDPKSNEVIYHEPAEVGGAYQRMSKQTFLKTWPLGKKEKRVVIRFPLEPQQLVDGEISTARTNADYVQHVINLKKTLPKGFRVFVQKPMVVIGNHARPIVRDYARGTVKYAVDRLKNQYFSKDPDEIIDVWLFKDSFTYKKYTKKLFGDQVDTPYGYYVESENRMMMNISTGPGTLIHEIVHPFMAANFPNCPPWFNEGMGSLYECSASRKGKIVGVTNWRLPGLQRAIKNKTVPTFKFLMAQNEQQFYNEDPGTNYAQSRYLLQYLQEKKLLNRYYHTFLKNRHSDPTGFQTLKQVLNIQDMPTFQKEWTKWVKKLRR